jgi:hypothetical protein
MMEMTEVKDSPGKRSRDPILINKSWAWWLIPVIPAMQEA